MTIRVKLAQQESKDSTARIRRPTQSVSTAGVTPGPAALLHLQRTHGNRFVQCVLSAAAHDGGQTRIAPVVRADPSIDPVSAETVDTTLGRTISTYGAMPPT